MNKKEFKDYITNMSYAELKGYYLEQLRVLNIVKENIQKYADIIANTDFNNNNYNSIIKNNIEHLVSYKQDIKYYDDILPVIEKILSQKESDQIDQEEYNKYIDNNKVNLKILFEAIEVKRQEFYNNPIVRVSKDKEITLSHEEIDSIINDLTIETISIIKDKIGNIEKVISLDFNNNRGFDGIIEGAEATLYIDTILAGGYNIQRLHYRTLTTIRSKILRGVNNENN